MTTRQLIVLLTKWETDNAGRDFRDEQRYEFVHLGNVPGSTKDTLYTPEDEEYLEIEAIGSYPRDHRIDIDFRDTRENKGKVTKFTFGSDSVLDFVREYGDTDQ